MSEIEAVAWAQEQKGILQIYWVGFFLICICTHMYWYMHI